jgi:hypothetical protein
MANVDAAIEWGTSITGRDWLRTELSDPVDLPDVIGEHDVLVIYEQSLASDAELMELGATWAVTLANFMGVGGVVVVVDGGQGNSGTWQVIDGAGLIEIASMASVSDTVVEVVDAGDAVTRGVSALYRAVADSVAYETSEPDVVVACPVDGVARCPDGSAIALHLTFVP